MHIFFSGIGGTAIGPLALIAKQAGYEVSGSDKQMSHYISYLKEHGVTEISIGQTLEQITQLHENHPIDWYVYSSAVEKENPKHPEMEFVRQSGIHMSKRDELLNKILADKHLKLIAVAGTHGKTTTTAMIVWLFRRLKIPVSYSVGAKIGFGEMGEYHPESTYFVYECDEFDKNFLKFSPYFSVITGVSYDHHEIYPTREDYKNAFRKFIDQSTQTILWPRDTDYMSITPSPSIFEINNDDPRINESLTLFGKYNREDAWIAISTVSELLQEPVETLIKHMNAFPGLNRRMERIAPGLYSDYAHTPEKIRGAMSAATELARAHNKSVVVVYEPLTNRRQHYMLDEYKDCFSGAKKIYWLPSYLAREDAQLPIITPHQLITHLDNPAIAEVGQLDSSLKKAIQSHIDTGDVVVCMSGGGGGSLDEWIRHKFVYNINHTAHAIVKE